MNFDSALLSHTALLFIAHLLIRAALLIALALVLDRLLAVANRSLLRSTCWNGLLVALVLLPIATLFVPTLMLPWLPAASNATHETALATQAPPASFSFDSPSRYFQPASREPVRSTFETAMPAPIAKLATPARPAAAGITLCSTLFAIYCLGAALLLARLAASMRAVNKLSMRTVPLTTPDWTDSLERCRRTLMIDRIIDLRTCCTIGVPVALGWRSPRILIPTTLAGTATGPQRESILLHELAHIRRHDYAWQLLLHIVQAVYWPNPLIWLVGRQTSAVREQICDEVCTHHADSPADYRDTLLHVASLLVRRPALSLGICMARTPQLAERLARIFHRRTCFRASRARAGNCAACAMGDGISARTAPLPPYAKPGCLKAM